MHKAVLVGASGWARCLLDLAEAQAACDIVGVVDNSPTQIGSTFMGLPILGNDSLLPSLRERGITHAIVGVGGAQDNKPRRNIYRTLVDLGFERPALVHPSAIVSPSVRLSGGTVVLPLAVIDACTVIGENVIISTGALIGHDCVVGSHVHVAPHATVLGGVHIDELSHIGANATINQSLRIGSAAVVGSGAVVTRDVASSTVVVGVPAKPIQSIRS